MKKIITLLLLLVLIPCTISISQNNFQIQAFSETVEEVFTYDIENDCCIITGYTGNESIIEIPEQIGNQTVIGISTNAFVNNKEIISAVLPTTIVSIGDSAFFGCTKLESINIPFGVTAIKSNTFNRCESLTSISIPESVISIETGAFSNCNNLLEINIKHEIKNVGCNAFKNTAWFCNQEEGYVYISNVLYGYKGNMPEDEILEIPNNINCIAACALSNQINLTNVIFHNDIQNIGWGAFENTGIEELVLPPVSIIGEQTFYNCSKLRSVTIPDTVNDIGFDAFEGCNSLSEVYFTGNQINSIGMLAFNNCTSLKQISLPESITSIGQWAFGYYDSEPDGCEIISYPIENFAIYGCTGTVAEAYANENGFTFIALDEVNQIITDTTSTTTETTTTTTTTTLVTTTESVTSEMTTTTIITEPKVLETTTGTTTIETTIASSDATTNSSIESTTTTIETTTVCTSPDTTTTTSENNNDIPQTGMPWARSAEGLAVILTVGGAIVALKSRKK